MHCREHRSILVGVHIEFYSPTFYAAFNNVFFLVWLFAGLNVVLIYLHK